MLRNFDTISPSAKSLLLTKSLTDIPFVAAAAELVWGKEALAATVQQNYSASFLARVLHFESRYKSIDVLLEQLQPANVLELSSGFSFRGLNMAAESNVFYVDTDLPALMDTKKQLLQALTAAQQVTLKGTLQLQPLNVLEEAAFRSIIALFPPGPVTIVNEGLLVYLNEEEKRKLCAIIHALLQERGGEWITGDIYIRKEMPQEDRPDAFSERFNQFLAQHHVEENKFADFETAAAFFTSCYFSIEQKIVNVAERLSALRLLSETEKLQLGAFKGQYRIRETWQLIAV